MTDAFAFAPRILFVDDETQVLRGLERMLRPMRNDWTVAFASSGADALARLDVEHFDMLVTDMQMPGMNGTRLLEEVASRHASTIRLVLTGEGGPDLLVTSTSWAHQVLTKPFDGDDLCARIGQALSMRTLLHNKALLDLVARLRTLPSLPSLYLDIVAELKRENPSSERVAVIVSRDMAMTAKLLQLVNSAMFALRQEVRDAETAVRLLGLDVIRTLALSAHVFSSRRQHGTAVDADALWAHTIRVSEMARCLMAGAGRPAPIVSDAMTAGLLHDVGKLVLAEGLDEYGAIVDDSRRSGRPLHDVERERLGTTHAEVGAYLLGIWGLPAVIVEAVARHHARDDASSFGPNAAVFLANRLVTSGGGREAMGVEDQQWIDGLQVANWRMRWRDCLPDTVE